jgi:hypothetical protein
MNLYLDDNINKGRLADQLRKVGHGSWCRLRLA